MIVLALDTTTKGGSCAIARDGEPAREHAGDVHAPQAARVPGELMALLEAEGLALPAVDAFAVAIGPGSFTGLRVGIAAMQGLAFATGKPLIGISALEALASRVRHDDAAASCVATWVDAWRGEIYTGLFDEGRQVDDVRVESAESALRRLGDRRPLFAGDGVPQVLDRIRGRYGEAVRIADPVAPPLAGEIARLAARRYMDGDRPPPHAIRPLYVRRSDAELARDARAGA